MDPLIAVPVSLSGYLYSAERAKQLQESVFADITSVMDFGIIFGALLASGLAGKFHPGWKVPPRSLVAAVVGGLLLGYGARLAYGCNIGALFQRYRLIECARLAVAGSGLPRQHIRHLFAPGIWLERRGQPHARPGRAGRERLDRPK
jgi:hypothetical protein